MEQKTTTTMIPFQLLLIVRPRSKYRRESVHSHLGLISFQSVSGNWTLNKGFSAELGKGQQELMSALPECLSVVSFF